MEPIEKPNIDNIETDIKSALRSGKKMIYDLMQIMGTAINKCIDWVMTNGATLKANEDERLTAEGSNDSTSEYYGGRAKEFAEWQELIANWKTIYEDKGSHIIDNDRTSFYAYAGYVQYEGLSLEGDQVAKQIPAATTGKAGVMTAADKTNLDGSVKQIVSASYDEQSNGIQLNYKLNDNSTSSMIIEPATQEEAGVMSPDDKTALDGSVNGESFSVSSNDDGIDVKFKDNQNTDLDFTIPKASNTSNGVMSIADKQKLDVLPATGAYFVQFNYNQTNRSATISLNENFYDINVTCISCNNLGTSKITVKYESSSSAAVIVSGSTFGLGTVCKASAAAKKLTIEFEPSGTDAFAMILVETTLG